ncbi:Flagellar hook-length control protein FliK [Minicystis rosea]|nr:Flagellar hook-length control protein FliK [Minicystis rosea]
MRAPLLGLVSSLSALLVIGSIALADGGTSVVLLGPSADHPLVVRLRRELELVGIEVTLVIGAEHRDLARTAHDHHAAAAVAVEASPPAVVLWTDPAQHPTSDRGAEIRVESGAGDPQLLALRAVETLRERLLPAPPPEARASAAPPASAAPTTPPPTSPPPLSSEGRGPSAFVGGAVLASPGGVSVTPHVWLGLRWAPVERVDLELIGFLPTTAATVSASEGSMHLRAGAVGAGATARFGDPRGLFAAAGAGFGALVSAYGGEAEAPWRAVSGVRASLFPYAHAAAGVWLARHFALRADLLCGFALPQPVLVIANRHLATFGDPTVVIAAGLEVRP